MPFYFFVKIGTKKRSQNSERQNVIINCKNRDIVRLTTFSNDNNQSVCLYLFSFKKYITPTKLGGSGICSISSFVFIFLKFFSYNLQKLKCKPLCLRQMRFLFQFLTVFCTSLRCYRLRNKV